MTPPDRLTRRRWAVRAVLALGVTASFAANVLHARNNPISQAIAGWPPIALLLTVELISRIPVYQRGLATVRIAATAAIAGIAAWISYWHMAGVAAHYGETGASAKLLPLSVDGLIVVASVCLVELGARLDTPPATPPTPPAPGTAAIGDDTTAPVTPTPTNPEPRRPTSVHAASCDHPAPTTSGTTQPAPTTPRPATIDSPAPLKPSTRPSTPQIAASASGQPVIYEPVSDDDRAMYQAWKLGIERGQEPTGAQLARAAGRADDGTGLGRRAARRYRDAHTNHRDEPALSI